MGRQTPLGSPQRWPTWCRPRASRPTARRGSFARRQGRLTLPTGGRTDRDRGLPLLWHGRASNRR
eukprot:5924685-Lingulodinium_polyedra.AAC.1